MKRWMIVYVLPLEVWVDIFSFPWIDRKEFGRIVDIIGNFKFAEHAQFYLHEWGKRKLTDIVCKEDGLYKYVNGEPHCLSKGFPQTPLPNNIRSFDMITIHHFDAKTMDFLGKIGQLLKLKIADLQLHLVPHDDLDNFRTILTKVLPLLDGIYFLRNYSNDAPLLPMVRQCFSREKWAKLKVLYLWHPTGIQQNEVNFIMKWLHQTGQGGDNGPRVLAFNLWALSEKAFSVQIFRAVRKQFLAAKTPRTFAVLMENYFPLLNNSVELEFAEFHLQNGIGEELHGVWTGIFPQGGRRFEVTRHRTNGNTELQEWIKKNTYDERKHSQFCICQPTIGSLDVAPQMDMPHADGEQEENQQQPSCSSKET